MDKLGPVCEILTQNNYEWEEWGLEQLVEKMQKYIEKIHSTQLLTNR